MNLEKNIAVLNLNIVLSYLQESIHICSLVELQSQYNMHFHSSLGLIEKENKNMSLIYVLVLVHWWFPWDSHSEPLIRDSI